MPRKKKAATEQQPETKNGRHSVNAAVKSICDIMKADGDKAGAMQYVPELNWLLFLRVLDEKEAESEKEAKFLGVKFKPSLAKHYRWRDWAAKDGEYRKKLQESGGNALLDFVNDDLLPHLRALARGGAASKRQKVIAQIMRGIDRTAFVDQRNMLDALNLIDRLRQSEVDDTHVFTLSQVYEGLLLKMGEKNNDGGQFFTPREVVRAMVRVINPKVGETVYDPCCGTGGFLAQSFEYMRDNGGDDIATTLETLGEKTFYGREKDAHIYPITLANLVLHGIDYPLICHGNTLTGIDTDNTLVPQSDLQKPHNVIITNPPFGGKEGVGAQAKYDYKTKSTQVLFMQEVIDKLKNNGRCGIVMDEGFLFKTDKAFVETRHRLVEECDLWCIVSLPVGVFSQAGAGVKTNLLFFAKGKPTEKIWYYDLGDVKVTKRQPLTLRHFDDFFALLPKRADSANSWTVNAADIAKNNYDLKAKNPNKKPQTDPRTPDELMAVIRQKTKQITTALDQLTGQ